MIIQLRTTAVDEIDRHSVYHNNTALTSAAAGSTTYTFHQLCTRVGHWRHEAALSSQPPKVSTEFISKNTTNSSDINSTCVGSMNILGSDGNATTWCQQHASDP